MTGNLLNQGMMLLVYGMGVVFLFLTVLIIATSLMSKLVIRFAGQEEAPQPKIIRPGKKPQKNDQQLICIISTAIHHYRKRHNKNH